ncbi:uncharacterized protein LOC125897860 [Epinephelus fuscoguttatus]|uniref:uncharacterized protein LOC125897860 n=1 Tax=Epinephelus fuscoguttatus TaxID=293821 RepID=UPI0020D0E1A8|nr:uncharacterized protein LOC125897860 [Epinephelus fuscoguttatus]
MQRGAKSRRGNRAGIGETHIGPENQVNSDAEMEGAALKGASGTEGEDVREPTLRDLTCIIQAFMGQQEAREVKRKEEAIRQEHRFKALQHQFQQLQQEVQVRTSPVPELTSTIPDPRETPDPDDDHPQARAITPSAQIHPAIISSGQSRVSHEPRLEKLTENDDVEHFLITFERIAAACQWPKSDWVFRLIPLLTGKARGAYVHMDVDESLEYDKVKTAVLKQYDINPETYRQRFRSLDVGPDESPKELYVRLKELYGKWIQPQGKTVQQIGETIMEQYLRMLSPELQVWVKEHGPKSAAEAATLADVFVAARKKSQPWTNNAWQAAKDTRRPTPPQYHQKSTPGVSKPPARENQHVPLRAPNKIPTCYLCGQEGHTKPMCPKNPAKLTQMCYVPRQNSDIKPKSNQSMKMTNVKINGKNLRALIDTGSTQTLVHRQYVPVNAICTLETIPICCVHGDEKPYPTADIYIEVQGQAYLLNIGVVDNLPFPVVLGDDLPVLFDLLNPTQSCNVALTRAQAKHADGDSPALSALLFYGVELETQPGKSRKPRSQRRQEKFQCTAVQPSAEAAPDMPLGFQIPTNIIQMQQNDPTLSTLLQRAKEREPETEPDGRREEYFLQSGVLYHRHGQVKQLVIPQAARDVVLTLGHAIPWAGHLGKHKTTARIKRHFHWPGLCSDVAQFCRSCPQCQKTSIRGLTKAPLQPLPIISTPFECLGMDIVGPVEKSKTGNRFMLVITDYGTRYPEVFPLKSIKAKTVAFSLVQFFSRVGFPHEILTDQATNFMSTLLKQVYQLLGIKSVRTTPYHPQTDGLTERFNQTLKQMLRKFVNETGSDWDHWLPYLLFAYWEVPQASTGFSPFELLCGHEVRGPLTLLRETWEVEQGREEPVNVISYVIQMREKLQRMSQLAQTHMVEAHWKDKERATVCGHHM